MERENGDEKTKVAVADAAERVHKATQQSAKRRRKSAAMTFDWTKCRSEGGSMECARCRGAGGNGTLPCDLVDFYKNCPDDKLWKGNFLIMDTQKESKKRGGNGLCSKFTSGKGKHGTTIVAHTFPGGVCDNSAPVEIRNFVATKASVTHPHSTSLDVGLFVFKRLVVHRCTGLNPTFCKKGEQVADVFKVQLPTFSVCVVSELCRCRREATASSALNKSTAERGATANAQCSGDQEKVPEEETKTRKISSMSASSKERLPQRVS